MFSHSFTGLARVLLLLCLLLATLTHSVYSANHCKGRLPKFCFLHPGKRNSPEQQTIGVGAAAASQSDQYDDEQQRILLDNMQISDSDTPSLRTMDAILSILMAPVEEEEGELP